MSIGMLISDAQQYITTEQQVLVLVTVVVCHDTIGTDSIYDSLHTTQLYCCTDEQYPTLTNGVVVPMELLRQTSVPAALVLQVLRYTAMAVYLV